MIITTTTAPPFYERASIRVCHECPNFYVQLDTLPELRCERDKTPLSPPSSPNVLAWAKNCAAFCAKCGLIISKTASGNYPCILCGSTSFYTMPEDLQP